MCLSREGTDSSVGGAEEVYVLPGVIRVWLWLGVDYDGRELNVRWWN